MNPGKAIQNKINGVKQNFADYKKLDSKDKKTYWKEFLLNNALYILLIVAIIYTYIQNSISCRRLPLSTLSACPQRTFPLPVVLRDVSY